VTEFGKQTIPAIVETKRGNAAAVKVLEKGMSALHNNYFSAA